MTDQAKTARGRGWVGVSVYIAGMLAICLITPAIAITLGIHPHYTSPEGYFLIATGAVVGTFCQWWIRKWMS